MSGVSPARRLKDKLRKKELALGAWIQLAHPQITEMTAKSGLDFVVCDMEHTAIAMHELFQTIQIVTLSGVAALVRVGSHDPLGIKRALDAGADGIIVPMVETADQARAARDAVYYPPFGKRGVGLARAQGFGMEFDAYRDRAKDETIFIPQIEHHRAVDALEDILAVEGVDGFLTGPYDLSGSLGKPGQFDDPEVAAALSRVAKVVASHAKPSGMHVVHPDGALLKQRIAEGYRFIAYGTDMVLYANMLKTVSAHIDAARESVR